jgi:hypothetical protein
MLIEALKLVFSCSPSLQGKGLGVRFFVDTLVQGFMELRAYGSLVCREGMGVFLIPQPPKNIKNQEVRLHEERDEKYG